MTRPFMVYIEASLIGDDESVRQSVLDLAAELEIGAVVVGDTTDLPADMSDAWHLTDAPPVGGDPRWSRTLVVGPRIEPGRRALVGLRQARDVRAALIELAAEHVLD